MPEDITPPEEPTLADQLEPYIQYEHATTAQRFFNFLIDNIAMGFGLSYLTAPVIGFMIGGLLPDYAMKIYENPTSLDELLLSYVVGIVNLFLYYPLCEKAFNGYTLGKLVTGSRAIKSDGRELTFKDAFMRTLCRMVPFEPLSALGGNPWHDQWTKTAVVKSR